VNLLKKLLGFKDDSATKDQSCCQVKIVEMKEDKANDSCCQVKIVENKQEKTNQSCCQVKIAEVKETID
jgi:hypothetical protein